MRRGSEEACDGVTDYLKQYSPNFAMEYGSPLEFSGIDLSVSGRICNRTSLHHSSAGVIAV